MAKDPVTEALARCFRSIPQGGRAVLAVSGGVDSMVLLEAAAALAGKNFESSRLTVAHVNHGLRGAESQADERLVRARARKLGLAFECLRLTWNTKASQNACRLKREAFLASLAPGSGDRILYAHHLNDQAETVLFRLIRGTGLRGLRGILPASGKKLRPFLGLEKAVLLAWARERKLTWREDSSNASSRYERNWIRNVLLPQIEERRPGAQEKLAALAAEAREAKAPPPALDLFRLRQGITFLRPLPSRAPAAGHLSEVFGLSRKHAADLEALLRKPSGECQCKGVRFTWSAGILLAERGVRFADSSRREGEKLESCLGVWTLPPEARLVPLLGYREKKRLKSLKVPSFFRESVPVGLDPAGRCQPMLPGRLTRVHFEPSPLARWWLARSEL